MAERWKAVAAVLALAIALAVVSFRVWKNLNVAGEPQVPRYGMQDFRDAVYYPATAFVAGENPYDRPFYTAMYPVADAFALYSPLTLLLHAPFALVSYPHAELIYYVLTAVLTVALGALALSFCGVPATVARVAGLGAVLVLTRPGHWNLFNGQVTLQAVLPALAALYFAGDRPLLAGAALAITTFKPTYGVPLAALLACRGEWRTIVIGGAIAVALTAPVVARLVAVSGGVTPFVASLQTSYDARYLQSRKLPERSPFRVDVVALAGRLLGRSPGNGETLVLTLGTLGAAGLALSRLRRRTPKSRDAANTAALARDVRVHASGLAALAVILCAYHQQYDLLILVLPLVALVWRPDTRPWRAHPMLRWAALALMSVPFANYAASKTGVHAARLSADALLAASSLNNVALLALLAIFIAVMPRPEVD